MKGLQGERLRQAFKYLDSDQDGFIKPDQFKRIILVSFPEMLPDAGVNRPKGNCWSQTFRRCYRQTSHSLHTKPGTTRIVL